MYVSIQQYPPYGLEETFEKYQKYKCTKYIHLITLKKDYVNNQNMIINGIYYEY